MKTALCLLAGFLVFEWADGQVITREIAIKKGQTYLNLPVKNSSKLIRSRIKLKETVLDEFTIKLADDAPDFWVFFDATEYQGKTLTIEIEKNVGGPRSATTALEKEDSAPLSRKGLDLIFADSKFPGQAELYKEKDRPQVHFSSRRGWLNDPNGLAYYNDEYHLYYQHNPYGWDWGNMHWGHAVSKDLVHWTELKDAIFPMNNKDAAFSGSAVIDKNNTAGFRRNGVDPLIAFYTSTGRGECMKLSYDNGRTFIDYQGNPVVQHSGRDPKVFWYEPGPHWVMVIWDNGHKRKLPLEQEAIINQQVIYTSPDLKTWTYQSGVAGFFECPELFELPVEGQPGVAKWVMYDATGRYVVGDFDGKKFSVDQELTQYEYGGGYFYASQTYNNMLDNRRVQVGWGRNIVHPGMPFNQAMLFPTELKLKKTAAGFRLCPTPIREINLLHTSTQTITGKVLRTNEGVSVGVNGDALHVIAEFEKGDAAFGVNVLGYELAYNDLLGEFSTSINVKLDTRQVSGPFATTPASVQRTVYARANRESFKIEVITDKNIIEIFVNDGDLYFVAPFDGEKTAKVEAFVKGRGERKSLLTRLSVHELASIWPQSTNN